MSIKQTRLCLKLFREITHSEPCMKSNIKTPSKTRPNNRQQQDTFATNYALEPYSS